MYNAMASAILSAQQAKIAEEIEEQVSIEFEKALVSDFGHVLWCSAENGTSPHSVRMEKLSTIAKGKPPQKSLNNT